MGEKWEPCEYVSELGYLSGWVYLVVTLVSCFCHNCGSLAFRGTMGQCRRVQST